MGRYKNSGIGKGIGTSPQTTLENQEYENKVYELEKSKLDEINNKIEFNKRSPKGDELLNSVKNEK